MTLGLAAQMPTFAAFFTIIARRAGPQIVSKAKPLAIGGSGIHAYKTRRHSRALSFASGFARGLGLS